MHRASTVVENQVPGFPPDSPLRNNIFRECFSFSSSRSIRFPEHGRSLEISGSSDFRRTLGRRVCRSARRRSRDCYPENSLMTGDERLKCQYRRNSSILEVPRQASMTDLLLRAHRTRRSAPQPALSEDDGQRRSAPLRDEWQELLRTCVDAIVYRHDESEALRHGIKKGAERTVESVIDQH